MAMSTEDLWKRFARWAYRYKRACDKAIEELVADGLPDLEKALFITEASELSYELDYGRYMESELSERISNKIKFLRGYLIDISFDGPKFMEKHLKFLTAQYPSKCANSTGVWLEQNLDGKIQAGDYFGFQESNVNFFCKSIKDVDLVSMHSILPFDRMYVSLPNGRSWDKNSVDSFVKQVKDDLESELPVKIRVGKPDWLLPIKFTWK